MKAIVLMAEVLAVFLSGSTVHSQAIVNGSLTGPNNTFSLIPPGWTTLFPGDPNSNADTEGAFGPHEAYGLSPDAGTFVAGAHATTQVPTGIEGIQQMVAGLTVGVQYMLNFYQSNLGYGPDNLGGSWSAFGNWQLYIDGNPSGLFSDTIAPETGPLPNNLWFASSITFTAASVTHEIGIGPNSVSGQNAFLGIDGIQITPIPEPSSVLLATLLAATFPFMRRRVP